MLRGGGFDKEEAGHYLMEKSGEGEHARHIDFSGDCHCLGCSSVLYIPEDGDTHLNESDLPGGGQKEPG